MVGEKHDYILQWHTHWEKKKHTWADKQAAPLPRIQAAFKHTQASVCVFGVFTGVRLGGTGVRPSNTLIKHTPAAPNSFNAHSVLIMYTLRMQNTHGHKKRIKTNKQEKTQSKIYLRLLFILEFAPS